MRSYYVFVCICVFVLTGCCKHGCLNNQDMVTDSFEQSIYCAFKSDSTIDGFIYIQDSTISDTIQCLADAIITFKNLHSLKITSVQFQTFLVSNPDRKVIFHNTGNIDEKIIFERYERALMPFVTCSQCQVIDEKNKKKPSLRQRYSFCFYVIPMNQSR